METIDRMLAGLLVLTAIAGGGTAAVWLLLLLRDAPIWARWCS